jgi:hypothetical protein
LERAGQTREREPSIISLTNTDKPERQTFLGARRASKKKRERVWVEIWSREERKRGRESFLGASRTNMGERTIGNTSYKHGQVRKRVKRDIVSLERERQAREAERVGVER